jgi:hypothetical protein
MPENAWLAPGHIAYSFIVSRSVKNDERRPALVSLRSSGLAVSAFRSARDMIASTQRLK